VRLLVKRLLHARGVDDQHELLKDVGRIAGEPGPDRFVDRQLGRIVLGDDQSEQGATIALLAYAACSRCAGSTPSCRLSENQDEPDTPVSQSTSRLNLSGDGH